MLKNATISSSDVMGARLPTCSCRTTLSRVVPFQFSAPAPLGPKCIVPPDGMPSGFVISLLFTKSFQGILRVCWPWSARHRDGSGAASWPHGARAGREGLARSASRDLHLEPRLKFNPAPVNMMLSRQSALVHSSMERNSMKENESVCVLHL